MELGPIEFKRKTGLENIVNNNKERSLLNFWQWAYSDLIGNTERGQLAEYLVALACGIDDKARISWDAYDLELNNGIKIEVKSSGYIQTWKQKSYSKPIFNIPKTLAWDYKEGAFAKEKQRQADIYVFALHTHLEQETIDPLNTNQWIFYILKSKILDDVVRDTKQISLDKIIKFGAIKSNWEELLRNITLAASKSL